jgi:hypothetical protein
MFTGVAGNYAKFQNLIEKSFFSSRLLKKQQPDL